MKRILLAAAAAVTLTMGAPVLAAPTGTTGSCQIGPTGGATDGDISLTISGSTYFSSACRSPVATGGGVAVEVSRLNTAFGTSLLYLDKDDGQPSAIGLGITFTVEAPSTKSGTWTINWAEAPGAPNLPATMNLIVGLFGGSSGAGYYFSNVMFPISPTSGSGFFEVEFTNPAGKIPDLSHMILMGEFTSAPPPPAVPEPMSLGLFGLGLLGLGAVARRHNARLTTA